MKTKQPRARWFLLWGVTCGWALSGGWMPVAAAPRPQLRFRVHDERHEELPCRIHVWDQAGQPQRPEGLPFWYDHFVCAGQAELSLPAGNYRYLVERGPEYERREGELTLAVDGPTDVPLTLPRLADLKQQGWYAADLHVHRPIEHIELLMRAEDLDLAPVITWWNTRNLWAERDLPGELWQRTRDGRWFSLMAGEDEREGGALLYFGLREPLEIATPDREFPSPLVYVDQARQQQPNVWIDIEKPFWWDVPVWLASGKMQSIGLANNHMCRDQMLPNEAWGRPRDVRRLPDPHGNGWWTQEIYYHLLNAGIRLPPSAGSASGVLPNPVGYNRVYVHLDAPLGPDAWWRGLSQGRCFVTNGPLLICQANGQWPGAELGAELTGAVASERPIKLQIQLISREPIERLEVVHNGAVIRRLEVTGAVEQQLQCELPRLESGWFLVRAIADLPRTFRFASTGPFYLPGDGQAGRISRGSVKFFQDWLEQRIGRVIATPLDPQRRAAVLQHQENARQFWRQRWMAANAD